MSKRAKRQAGPSSSKGGSGGSSEPTVKFLDREHRDRFKCLSTDSRKVKATKFLHSQSFEALGVLEGVIALFANIGWDRFLTNRAPTYITPTREFLASLQYSAELGTVAFQLLGAQHSITLRNINALMGTQTDNTYVYEDPFPVEFDQNGFWQEIADEYPFSTSSKASSIIHPCLRLALRTLVCTIFCRKEVGQVTKTELFFLWCMTRVNGPRPDFATFFSHKCYNASHVDTGEIHIGGLITLIATRPPLSLVIPSPPFQKADGHTFLDLNALSRMCLIQPRPPRGYPWFHSTSRNAYLILPDYRIGAFDPTNPETWKLTPQIYEEEILEEEEEVPGPQQFAQLPPNFAERFDQLCLSTQQIQQQVTQMWGWHQSQHHFDQYPYPPPDPPM